MVVRPRSLVFSVVVLLMAGSAACQQGPGQDLAHQSASIPYQLRSQALDLARCQQDRVELWQRAEKAEAQLVAPPAPRPPKARVDSGPLPAPARTGTDADPVP